MYQFKEDEYEAMMDYICHLKRMLYQHHVHWDEQLSDADERFWDCLSNVTGRKYATNKRMAEMMQEKRKSGNPKYLRGKAKEKYLQEHPEFQ